MLRTLTLTFMTLALELLVFYFARESVTISLHSIAGLEEPGERAPIQERGDVSGNAVGRKKGAHFRSDGARARARRRRR